MEPVLIATDSSLTDVCAITSFTLDMVIGHDAQDFKAAFKPRAGVGGGSLLYIDGTEYGGIVDDVTTDTESDVMECHGRTWDGILACKRIMPPSGQAYRTVSGEANTVLDSLVTLLDVGDVFAASTEDSGITITSYQFDRFVDGYTGITSMLASAGAKLVMRRDGGKTVMSAAAKQTISDEADSDLMEFAVTKAVRCVNHLVCAGDGELQERVVLDLYSDADGNVSTTQTFTGRDEITAFYDYNNADAAELLAEGAKKLKEYYTRGAVDISRIGRGDWGIGDTLVARDNQSGITVSTPIAGKTVQVGASTNWEMHVEYVVGEAERMNPSSSGTAEQPEKVNRDGDTMTGDLIMNGAVLRVKLDNTDASGTPTDGNSHSTDIGGIVDPNGLYLAYVSGGQNAAGRAYARLAARHTNSGTTLTNYIDVRVMADGSFGYGIADAKEFLNALNAGAIYTSTITDIITPASGITITRGGVTRWGRVCMLEFSWKRSSDINVPASGNITNVDVGTVAATYRQNQAGRGTSNGDDAGAAWYTYDSSGLIKLSACEGTGAARTITAGTVFNCRFTYLCQSDSY